MTVLNMDCIEGMRLFPDAYFDSVVTDPPYELTSARPGGRSPATEGKVMKGFMGMEWDGSGIAYSVEMWTEALRVLKPGGHLLAFSGSRTYHRMVCAIEDAGFEIRDQIMWVYGSGFPKSLDVSKAIDKAGGDALAWRAFSAAYAAAIEASALKHSDVDRALGIKSSSCYWARVDHRGGMPPRHHWEQVRALLQLPESFARLYDEAEREVIGQSAGSRLAVAPGQGEDRSAVSLDITAPATDAARQWQGWGTALKPAHEPIVVARKPLIGTVAANVLQFGTGALNIDGCRVGLSKDVPASNSNAENNVYGAASIRSDERGGMDPNLGRWPANLIHDGSDEVLAAFPQAPGQMATASTCDAQRISQTVFGAMVQGSNGSDPRVELDKSAARFFYCSKASKADRNSGGIVSTHPTVKPTDLMRYLCRLVTPPGGTVLDPFTGSGSTGKAARLEGFGFIGFELSEEYTRIATARIAGVTAP